MVRIAGFHPADPGSIPGVEMLCSVVVAHGILIPISRVRIPAEQSRERGRMVKATDLRSVSAKQSAGSTPVVRIIACVPERLRG